MQKKINRKIRSMIAAVLMTSVAAAAFAGCNSKDPDATEGIRDGNDINTFATTEETVPTPTLSPTPTNSPTPTPSPTPAIPHMNMPDVGIKLKTRAMAKNQFFRNL